MRVSSSALATTLLMLSCAACAHAGTDSFTANLSLGSSGAQVIALQKFLNQDPATRVAATGQGSPGNETGYFGSLTQAAVIRFQEKYAQETLAPAGLAQGTGYVGSYTRAELNLLSAPTASAGNPTTATASPAVPLSTSSPSTVSQNPNLQNLGTFLADIDTVGAQQNIPAATLALVKAQVTQDAATTTDLRAAFLKLVQNSSNQSNAAGTPFTRTFAGVLEQTLAKLFVAEPARAAVGSPFGGPLVYAFYCNCSAQWLITIGPLPPTYVTLLSYVSGSQAYLSYNIPATNWLLGEYSAGGVCAVFTGNGCATIPSEGLITPTVGSSPT